MWLRSTSSSEEGPRGGRALGTGGRVALTAPAVVAGWLKPNAGNRLRSKVKTCPGENTIAL